MAKRSMSPWFRSGKNTWFVWFGGKQTSLKVKGEGNQAEAVKAWHRLMAQDAPTLPLERQPKPQVREVPKEQPVDPVRVKELADAFLADVSSRLKPNTVRIYRYDLGTLCGVYGKTEAASLTAEHISQWLLRLKVNSTTKAMSLRSVSAFLGWAERQGFIPTNPAKRVPKPRSRSRTDDAVVSEEDHRKLMAVASPEFSLVLRFLWATGCRPGEVGKVTAENFNPDAAVIRLTEHKSDRTGKPRLILLPDDIVALLKQQAQRFPTG